LACHDKEKQAKKNIGMPLQDAPLGSAFCCKTASNLKMTFRHQRHRQINK
jgi:hypothetical protein